MKIALCLSGLVGYVQKHGYGRVLDPTIAYNYFQENIFKPNENVDIFFHCWENTEQNKLLNLYNTKNYVFESKNNFKNQLRKDIINNKRKFSIFSRWYSNKKVLDILRNYEIKNNIKYDFVLLTRFDIAFKKQLVFNELNKDNFYYMGPEPIHFYSKKHTGQQKCCDINSTHFEINDLWFLANSDNIFKFTRLYYEIENLLNICPLSNHSLASQYLKNIGLFSKRKTLLTQKIHNSPGTGDAPLVRWIK